MPIAIMPFRLTLLAAAVAVSCSVHAQEAKASLTKDDKAARIQQVEVRAAADAYDPPGSGPKIITKITVVAAAVLVACQYGHVLADQI